MACPLLWVAIIKLVKIMRNILYTICVSFCNLECRIPVLFILLNVACGLICSCTLFDL